jgi:hypothetical protein
LKHKKEREREREEEREERVRVRGYIIGLRRKDIINLNQKL